MIKKFLFGVAFAFGLTLAAGSYLGAQPFTRCEPPQCLGGGSSLPVQIWTDGVLRWQVDRNGAITTPNGSISGLFAAGSATAPSIALATQTNTGIYFPTAPTVALTSAGNPQILIGSGVVRLGSVGVFGWSSNFDPTQAATDTAFSRLAASSILVGGGANGTTTGMELNLGVPTLGTCTGGSLTSGSHNFGGEVTGNTSGSCVVNFGTPNWQNAPFCQAESESSLTHPRISARSTSSITITGTVSGESVVWHCDGRVGT